MTSVQITGHYAKTIKKMYINIWVIEFWHDINIHLYYIKRGNKREFLSSLFVPTFLVNDYFARLFI